MPDGPPPPSLLAEAFLAAAPPAFYEPRVDAATTLPGAVLRVARGRPSSASPLSLALARALLLDEGHGPRRQGREELLATALEGRTTVTARVDAWLQWVPLCRGRRGLARARQECLPPRNQGWTDADMATIAAAAAWGLDLAGDPHLLAARRDAVLEQLVRRGLVDAQSARSHALPGQAPPPASEDCLPQLLSDARRSSAASPSAAVRLESGIDGGVRALFTSHRVVAGLLLDPSDGVVRACRTAASADVSELAGHALAVATGGTPPGIRWLPRSEATPPPPSLDRLEAWNARLRMQERSGLRWQLAGDRLLIVHPTLAGAVALRDPSQAEAFVAALVRLLPAGHALLPDDLEVVRSTDGLAVRPRT